RGHRTGRRRGNLALRERAETRADGGRSAVTDLLHSAVNGSVMSAVSQRRMPHIAASLRVGCDPDGSPLDAPVTTPKTADQTGLRSHTRHTTRNPPWPVARSEIQSDERS